MMKRISVLLIIVSMAISLNSVAFAYDQETKPTSLKPSPGAVVLDLIALRPLGFAATIVGSILFAVSMPVTLPAGRVELMQEKLAIRPAYFTFVRPLGQMSLDLKY